MRHLTYTGFYAGYSLCGKSRSEIADCDNVHYAYAPEWMLTDKDTCEDCKAVLASLDNED